VTVAQDPVKIGGTVALDPLKVKGTVARDLSSAKCSECFLYYIFYMCEIVALNVCVSHYPLPCKEAVFKEKHGVWGPMPYAGVDYNLTLCPLQSRL